MTEGKDWADELQLALSGDEAALTALIAGLTPVIQVRVARSLLRHGTVEGGPALAQEVEELTQEVLLTLFDANARVLRSWDPERGLSLPGFVGLVTQRRVASAFRTKKAFQWTEDNTSPEVEPQWQAAEADIDRLVSSREQLARLLEALHRELSVQGRQLFRLLFVEELAVVDVQRATGLSRDAVYAWRSRLRRQALRLVGQLDLAAPLEVSGGGRR